MRTMSVAAGVLACRRGRHRAARHALELHRRCQFQAGSSGQDAPALRQARLPPLLRRTARPSPKAGPILRGGLAGYALEDPIEMSERLEADVERDFTHLQVGI